MPRNLEKKCKQIRLIANLINDEEEVLFKVLPLSKT